MWGFSPKTFIYLLDIEFLSGLCRSSNESKKSTPCIVPFSSEPPRHPSMKMKFKAASKRTYELSCGVKAKRHFGHYERLSDPLLSKPRSRFLTFNSQVKESIQIKIAIVQDSFIALQSIANCIGASDAPGFQNHNWQKLLPMYCDQCVHTHRAPGFQNHNWQKLLPMYCDQCVHMHHKLIS